MPLSTRPSSLVTRPLSLPPDSLRLAVALHFHFPVKLLHIFSFVELIGIHELNIVGYIKADRVGIMIGGRIGFPFLEFDIL
jgi:hypothetical protein